MRGTKRYLKNPATGKFEWVDVDQLVRPEPVAPMALIRKDRHFVSRTLPRGKYDPVAGEWKHSNPAIKSMDNQGRPQFDSMRKVQEAVSASQDVSDHDGLVYD